MNMDAQATVDLLRRIRHDFGNNLQVILGYIDLGRPEQARNYIQGLVQESIHEKNIFESCDPAGGIYFFQQLLAARDLGIILRYKNISVDSLDTVINSQEPLRSLQKIFTENGIIRKFDEEPQVDLSIQGTGSTIEMVFNCDDLDENPLRIIIKE